MKRPLADKRPFGPFAQNLEPNNNSLNQNELRILLGRLVNTVEDNVDALESLRDDEFWEGMEDMILNMTRFNTRKLDSAAEKLAGKHNEATGRFPKAWNEYKNLAEQRDQLLDEVS